MKPPSSGSHVHRYDKDGEYISSINGEEGEAGAFATPHGVWIDTRKAERELYVADRSNGRIQVYDLVGNYKRVLGKGPGADWLHSPSGFAQTGDFLITGELSPNPPKDTDGRREESGRGVRELQGK